LASSPLDRFCFSPTRSTSTVILSSLTHHGARPPPPRRLDPTLPCGEFVLQGASCRPTANVRLPSLCTLAGSAHTPIACPRTKLYQFPSGRRFSCGPITNQYCSSCFRESMLPVPDRLFPLVPHPHYSASATGDSPRPGCLVFAVWLGQPPSSRRNPGPNGIRRPPPRTRSPPLFLELSDFKTKKKQLLPPKTFSPPYEIYFFSFFFLAPLTRCRPPRGPVAISFRLKPEFNACKLGRCPGT